jgi:hypothetical protein
MVYPSIQVALDYEAMENFSRGYVLSRRSVMKTSSDVSLTGGMQKNYF